MEDLLLHALDGPMPGVKLIGGLRPLSGGAVQETWLFEVKDANGAVPLVLRRARGSLRADRTHGIDLSTEANVVRLAEQGNVPVPHIRYVLRPEDGLGEGFIMDFVEGETIPRRILRDQAFAPLRAGLAAECGEALASIHRLDASSVSGLTAHQPAAAIERIDQDYLALDAPGAVFELAFRWLRDNMIPDLERLSLVHGDFRLGNLLVGPDRLRAVLDWEGAHLGDPHEDLGYIAITSWRFGEIDRPVGGFGSRDVLFEAYERAGGHAVDPARVHFWEIAYTMNWGIQCAQMAEQFLTGADPSVERGAIGRRRSETELDLLNLLDRCGSHA
jgi:aminoglycoside phosphotransferase (APT) family kinase protein